MTKEQQGVVLFIGLIMLAYFVWDSSLLFSPPNLEKIKGDQLTQIYPAVIYKSPRGSELIGFMEKNTSAKESQSFALERQGQEIPGGNNLRLSGGANNSDSKPVGRTNLPKLPALLMPINLNKATMEELSTLPGIGPKTAQAILAFRDEHGPFKSVEELLRVRGLGPKKLAAIRERITVQ